MLNIAVFVSGGGTNLQALIDAQKSGLLKSGKITLVLSSKKGVFALERAEKNGIETAVISRKDLKSSEDFDRRILQTVKSHNIDIIVLAGFLSILGDGFIKEYKDRHNKRPSFPYSGLLRQGDVRAEGSRGGARSRSKADRSDGRFCKRNTGRRPYYRPKRGRGAAGRHAGDIAKKGNGAGRMDLTPESRGIGVLRVIKRQEIGTPPDGKPFSPVRDITSSQVF